jgi:hypothetical protein
VNLRGCISFGFRADSHEAGQDLVRRMVESLTKREEIDWATGIANPSEPARHPRVPEPETKDPEALFT